MPISENNNISVYRYIYVESQLLYFVMILHSELMIKTDKIRFKQIIDNIDQVKVKQASSKTLIFLLPSISLCISNY